MVLIEERLHSIIDKYEAKDFSYFFKTLEGFSEEMLKLHYGLYEGYIKAVNKVSFSKILTRATEEKGNFFPINCITISLIVLYPGAIFRILLSSFS